MSDNTSPVKSISINGTNIEVGDTVRVVVQEIGNEGDPIAFIGGNMTIIQMPEGEDNPSVGEDIRVKIADVSERYVYAVPPA